MLKNLYLIVGKSGSGKTTIVEELEKRFGYVPLASYTDRPPRYDGETGHVFVTEEEFNALGEMLAYTKFNGHQYGANQDLVDKSDLYVIDPPGIRFMRDRYKSDRPIKVIGIYVPQEELTQRMLDRGDTPEMVESRTANDDVMFKDMFDVCDVVFKNEDLEQTIKHIHQFINANEQLDLSHISAIHDIPHFIGGVYEVKECLLFNDEKISEDDAIAGMKAERYSPYALVITEDQWKGLFKNQ